MQGFPTQLAPRRRRAFSLVELVIVVVILGIIAAIAVPRASDAAVKARANALATNIQVTQRAIDLYIVEHDGRSPAHTAARTVDTNATNFGRRISLATDETGMVMVNGPFGPYMRSLPAANPINGLATLRIDGAPAGAGTHGYHFDSSTTLFTPDDVDNGGKSFDVLDDVKDTVDKLLGS